MLLLMSKLWGVPLIAKSHAKTKILDRKVSLTSSGANDLLLMKIIT